MIVLIPAETAKCRTFLKLCGRGRETIRETGSGGGGGAENSPASRTARPFSTSNRMELPVLPFRNPVLTGSPGFARRTVRMCSARSPETVNRRSGERESGWISSRFMNYQVSPVSACLRRMSRLTFPERVFGRVLTNSISRGYLYGALWCFACCCSSRTRDSVGSYPGLRMM